MVAFAAIAPIIAAAIPVAAQAAGSKKGGGVSTGTIPSPQQGHLWEKWGPLSNVAANFGMGNIQRAGGSSGGGGGFGMPQTGSRFSNMPALSQDPSRAQEFNDAYPDVPLNPYSGSSFIQGNARPASGGGGGQVTSLWDIPGYDIPDIGKMMPQKGWMDRLDPNIIAGLKEPFIHTQNQLAETLGGQGQLGSAGAGMSGAAADVFRDFWTKATPTFANQAWSMVKDPLAMGWQSEAAREQMLFAEQMQENKYPWANMPGMTRLGMPTPYAQPGGGGGGKK
jgi:hypothetical protein